MSGKEQSLPRVKRPAACLWSMAVLLAVSVARPVHAGNDWTLVSPANADTVFDYVLVFPADADDQALEAWRQRALTMAAATKPGSPPCQAQVVRFHVAASWQLPMLGLRCLEGTFSPSDSDMRLLSANDVQAPVWLAATSVNTVRGQVAAMLQ